jgi:pyruvate dehydrogenase E1 component alpha subunit
LKAMMAELYGKATGCCRGKGGSMHLLDLDAGFLGATPIVGSTIPIGVGTALGSLLQGEARVTAVFFGEGATEEGVFHESLNFAAIKRLPVLFVCENNLYSVYSPLAVRQPPGRDAVALAAALGVPGARHDGNDAVGVARLAREAVRRARAGEGPTFLEFATYRWREHCGPNYDNDLGYRSPEEFEAWRTRCPVEGLRRSLESSGELGDGEHRRLEATLEAEMEEAVTHARRSPFPGYEELGRDVTAAEAQAPVPY